MKRGFTLIELLIVIIVIALITVVVVYITPAVTVVSNTRASQVAQNFRNIKTAFENYFNSEKPVDPANITLNTLKAGYISHVPQNFTLNVEQSLDGAYKVSVIYTGKDVDLDKIRNAGLREAVKNDSNEIVYTFFVQKSW
ncbi:prepilin-type N-terminal cleavage/methylation domain-containing protein [Fervidobacterium sp.]